MCVETKNIISYPCLEIDIEKLRQNVKLVYNCCREAGVDVVGVTKVSNGSAEIAQAMIDGGVKIIGDSRIENFKKYQSLNARKMLIRSPMLSEIRDVVKYTDISLNSELEVIKAIDKEAEMNNKIHEIIIMVEAGDLREGIYDRNELFNTVKEASQCMNTKIVGLGANFNCFGSIKPTTDNLNELVKLKKEIKELLNVDVEIISGGNTGSVALIQSGKIPEGVNQLRIGTTFLVGFVENSLPRFPNAHTDAFRLKAEIIELKIKPSQPYGERGVDAFRNTPVFADKGLRKRAICAVGKQDCDPNFMYPIDKGVEIIGSSSDHIILDITERKARFQVGDRVEFVLDYMAILRCMTSAHVRKIYINE